MLYFNLSIRPPRHGFNERSYDDLVNDVVGGKAIGEAQRQILGCELPCACREPD
jgi:hypothetical protein